MDEEEQNIPNPLEQANSSAQDASPAMGSIAQPVPVAPIEQVTSPGAGLATELPQASVSGASPAMAPEQKSSKKALYLIIGLILVMIILAFSLLSLRVTKDPQAGPVIPTPTAMEKNPEAAETEVAPIQTEEDLSKIQTQVESVNPDTVGNELNQVEQDASALE
ncbi:hypothetical protein KKG52_01185 [Patescibacteria group bacterium]|nr:hypothetical protein [Patescibacteria group bacterium]